MKLRGSDLKALSQAQQSVRLMQMILPEKIRDTAPASVIGALMTVCLQHCDSILMLLHTGTNDASAEALMRPAIECAFRLHWAAGDKERARQLTANEAKFPSFSKLYKRLSASTKGNKSDTVLQLLHGYTHGGLEQLAQHFSKTKTQTPVEEAVARRLAAFFFVVIA